MIKRRILSGLMFAMVAALPFVSEAQLQTPAPSPMGMVKQTVGITDISLEYARPSAKGRKIFGDLVPYNEVWRTGANKATAITFSDEVTIGGTKIAKGKYSVFTIPSENEWTIIINKNTELWGSEEYKMDEDVVRLKAKAMASEMTETFTIGFSNLTNNGCTVDLSWDKTKVSFPVTVDTDAKVMSSIKDNTSSTWRTYAKSAEYILNNNPAELEMAKDLITKSIVLKEGWYNNWVKAQIMAKSGNFLEAYTAAEKSKMMGIAEGDKGTYKYYSEGVEKGIAEYMTKGNIKPKKK